jgi:hypothetical protein
LVDVDHPRRSELAAAVASVSDGVQADHESGRTAKCGARTSTDSGRRAGRRQWCRIWGAKSCLSSGIARVCILPTRIDRSAAQLRVFGSPTSRAVSVPETRRNHHNTPVIKITVFLCDTKVSNSLQSHSRLFAKGCRLSPCRWCSER